MKIRILFDCHTLVGPPQGTTSFLAGLINALPSQFKKLNIPGDLILICAASSKEAVDKYIQVPYQFLAISDSFLIRNIFQIPYFQGVLKVDYVVSQYVRPLYSSAKTISIIHDVLFLDYPEYFNWRYSFSRWALFGLSAKFSDYIFSVSRYSSDRLLVHYGVKDVPILSNAVSTDFLEKKPALPLQSKSPYSLLYVSRFESRKRQTWCIRLIKDLLDAGEDVYLTLVGSTVDAYHVEFLNALLVEPDYVKQRIVLRENISRSELLEIYSDTSIFLFPSVAEGFGIPVIEAAAMGIPCVVSSGSALDELSAHFSGAYFESYSYENFFQVVLKVINDFENFAVNAYIKSKAISENFNWDNAALAFCDKLFIGEDL